MSGVHGPSLFDRFNEVEDKEDVICPYGLVGYDVCLTRRRSPVRAWVRIYFFFVVEKICLEHKQQNAATGNRTQAIGATSRGTAPIL